ncbi:hypothetical protein [Caballeronia grimmiae]|uniref:hypothetical protein n=1 Tax=Caballeronia grimmiae TaxID=1071679 RepID=UPI000B0CD95D|nr:hypothetical protein [Caballeronia grimmiae]
MLTPLALAQVLARNDWKVSPPERGQVAIDQVAGFRALGSGWQYRRGHSAESEEK